MKSSVSYFRLKSLNSLVPDSAFNEFYSLSDVSRYIEESPFVLDYNGQLLQCFDGNGDLLFTIVISVSVLYKSEDDGFIVYSIRYSLSND